MRAVKLRDEFLMDSDSGRTLGDWLDHYEFLKKKNEKLQKTLDKIEAALDPSDHSPSRTHAEVVAEIRRVVAGEPLPPPPDPWNMS